MQEPKLLPVEEPMLLSVQKEEYGVGEQQWEVEAGVGRKKLMQK